MAVTTKIPAKLVLSQVDGSGVIDFDTDPLQVMLVRAGAGAPDTSKTGIQFVSNVTAANAEVAGGTYARKTLGSVTLAFGAGDDVDFSHSAASSTWLQDAAGPTDACYAIEFKNTGADATSRVYAVIDLGGTVSLRTGDLVLTPPAGGLIQWTKTP